MTETVLMGREGRVAILTINRPDKLNALSQQVRDDMLLLLGEIEKDDSVGVVVITGAGEKSFIAGADIAEFEGRSPFDQREAMASPRIFDVMSSFPKPVIAMINGFCLAGALEFAQCCDLRYCSEDSSFGVVETRFSNGIATMMMPWILGNRCRELIYTGDRFGAAEALRLGLVDRVFPKAALEAETIKIAKRMSRVALDCLKWNKRAINQTFETMGLRAAIQYGSEACAIMDATGSPEAAEFDRIRRADGLGAALQWRDAQFAQFE
jgi:enoyl-CoA hydratase/carnithine racemase